MSPNLDPSPIGRSPIGRSPIGRIGRYDLLGRLAMGGMAEIFLARESGPRAASRELVVKRILPQAAGDRQQIESFVQEARLSMRLRHPNICPIYEFGEERGAFFLAMEWVHGVSLRGLLGRALNRGGLPVPIALRIVSDIAAALQHAHTATDGSGQALRIVHRDITPENIMVGFDGVTKLVDFGVAKAASTQIKTQAGVLKGKFAYMSPEQYRGDELDGRADVFSLGVCLYESLTGEPLYLRESEYETVAAIVLDTRAPSLCVARPELPERLDRITRRALEKDRQDRYQSADELHEALELYLAETQTLVRPRMVAALLEEWFVEEIESGPELDRSPLVVVAPEPADPVRPENTPERFVLEAELDDEAERLRAAAKRKRVLVGLAAALVVLAVLVASFFAIQSAPPKSKADVQAHTTDLS